MRIRSSLPRQLVFLALLGLASCDRGVDVLPVASLATFGGKPAMAVAVVPQGPPAPPVDVPPAAPPVSVKFGIFLEESSPEFFVKLSRSQFLGFEQYSCVRFVPWRRIEGGKTVANIRMGLGYGNGFVKQVEDMVTGAIEKSEGGAADKLVTKALMEGLFQNAGNFEEKAVFQLDAGQARELIRLIDTIDSSALDKCPEHVSYRKVQASYGEFSVMHDDRGLFLYVPSGGWERLPADRLKAALRRAIDELDRLEKSAPSAKW